MRENVKGEMVNVGGNIAKRFPTEKVMPNLRAAMSPQQYQEFTDLIDLFRATGRAVDANSDTAFKMDAIKNAKLRDQGAIAKTIGAMRPLDWMKRARISLGEGNRFARRTPPTSPTSSRPAIGKQSTRLRALRSCQGQRLAAYGAHW